MQMKLPKLALAILVAGFATTAFTGHQANAVMINGALTFAGGAVFDTTSLATATRVNTFSDVFVTSASDDFASFVNVGDSVTMTTPYIFMPSTATPSLWSVGGFTYDLDASTVVLQNADFLIISGTGTVSGNGFDATAGIWNFTSQSPDADGVFSFSASIGGQGVPDGGTTVALLGIALAGVELIRRKIASA
jgi:hypothetical protein